MLLRVILMIALLVASSVASFKKCCPDGEDVQVDFVEDNELSPRRHFGCAPENFIWPSVKKKRESEGYDYDNSTFLTQIIGYNVIIDGNSHWPACSDNSHLSHRILHDTIKASQSASCVDAMNSRYYIFTCDEGLESARDFVEVHKLRKCCDKNSSYDVFTRQCVYNNNSSIIEDFQEFLSDKTVVFESGIPECKPDDVLVEYHSLVHNLKIFGSSLVVTTANPLGPDLIMQSSFCIEATINSVINLPDGANPQHFQLKASSKWIAKVCRPEIICDEIPCVRKCCKEGYRMVTDGVSICEEHDAHLDLKFHFFNYESSHAKPDPMEPKEYGILMPKTCTKFRLGDEEEEEHFFSGIDGSLFIPQEETFYSNDKYCVDYYFDASKFDPSVDLVKVETFVCFDEESNKKNILKFRIYATLLAISAAFLGFTFFVYVFLPKLLNLHGKTLVCHVISLFVAYSFLSVVQFATEEKMDYCEHVAYIVYFSFLAAFSWLNVMCLDIFWTFRSIRMSHGSRGTKEMKKFLCYSLYAWGFPCVATITTFVMDHTEWLPRAYRPNIAVSRCWFENSSLGHIIFFLSPIGSQVCVNVVLFVITAIHCNRVKAEIHRMQMNDSNDQKKRRYITDKAIFLMNVKLFTVMGISWLLEIFATLANDDRFWWYISDFFNLMQGVLVFFIFVFKRSVLVAFQKKLGIRSLRLRPKTPGSTSTNMSTLDLHSTSVVKPNGKMMKSNSSSTLTNSSVVKN